MARQGLPVTTHQDETLPQRYAREHQDYLKLCGSMTAEQVADLQLQLNNSLAREQALQQRLTAADERVDTAISLLECVLDTGELTREKHLDLEADICRLVTDFWGDRKSARIPSPPRCPDCGYTEQDCREQMDHHLCGSPEPAPARNP
jgi:DNA repair exonuclease SbcCD ATPase subunit